MAAPIAPSTRHSQTPHLPGVRPPNTGSCSPLTPLYAGEIPAMALQLRDHRGILAYSQYNLHWQRGNMMHATLWPERVFDRSAAGQVAWRGWAGRSLQPSTASLAPGQSPCARACAGGVLQPQARAATARSHVAGRRAVR